MLWLLSKTAGSLPNRTVLSRVCCTRSVLPRQISRKEVLTSTCPFDRWSHFTVEALLLIQLATPRGMLTSSSDRWRLVRRSPHLSAAYYPSKGKASSSDYVPLTVLIIPLRAAWLLFIWLRAPGALFPASTPWPLDAPRPHGNSRTRTRFHLVSVWHPVT